MRTHYLSDMTFEEAHEAFATTDTAFVPMGAVEAHGSHGLIGTDHLAAEAVAQRAAAKIPEVVTDYLACFATQFCTLPLEPQELA